MTGLLVAYEAFNGVRVLENTVRFSTMLIGIPLGLVMLKFGMAAMRRRELDRAWGTLSYALLLLLPGVGRAMNFGNPINWVTTALYAAALVTAAIGLYYRATLSGWWFHRTRRKGSDDAAG
jgi:hypothetical protein